MTGWFVEETETRKQADPIDVTNLEFWFALK
jgi:hypothetical protein